MLASSDRQKLDCSTPTQEVTLDNTGSIAVFMGIMVPISAIIITGLVIIFLMNYRYKERVKLHETLRTLAQTNSPHQDQLLTALMKHTVPQADRDLRMAIIMFGVGLGLLAMAFMIGLMDMDDEPYMVIWPLVAISIFPFAFGVGRFILWRMAVKRGEA